RNGRHPVLLSGVDEAHRGGRGTAADDRHRLVLHEGLVDVERLRGIALVVADLQLHRVLLAVDLHAATVDLLDHHLQGVVVRFPDALRRRPRQFDVRTDDYLAIGRGPVVFGGAGARQQGDGARRAQGTQRPTSHYTPPLTSRSAVTVVTPREMLPRLLRDVKAQLDSSTFTGPLGAPGPPLLTPRDGRLG